MSDKIKDFLIAVSLIAIAVVLVLPSIVNLHKTLRHEIHRGDFVRVVRGFDAGTEGVAVGEVETFMGRSEGIEVRTKDGTRVFEERDLEKIDRPKSLSEERPIDELRRLVLEVYKEAVYRDNEHLKIPATSGYPEFTIVKGPYQ
jgi:hypothetical protein